MEKIDYEELQKKYPPSTFGIVNVKREDELDDCCKRKWDGENYLEPICENYGQNTPLHVKDLGWSIFLDHSCGEWVIGGAAAAKELAASLLLAAEYCEANECCRTSKV